MRPGMRHTYIALPLLAALAGCAATPASPADVAADETGVEGPFDPMPPESKFDLDGERGPRVRDGAATEVWAVTRDWADVEGEAGIAWPADSGWTWEQKFDAWVAAAERMPRSTGYGETFRIPTPYGERSLEAPTLECAEVALLMRMTFAAWYELPFFIQGWDAHTRQTMYAGHFGFVNRDGANVSRFPSFRTRYADHRGDWAPGEPWPRDERLRGYRLGDDDGVPFLEAGAGAGAYFDELFLNKRAGYFARLILLYFGSANLADEANMFHITPESTRAGDVLLERWQRRGIGHTIPVMRVDEPVPGRLAVHVASGSMPRRQPLWEEPASARSSFTLAAAGGEGEARDGTPYAELGGGIRRWRTAVRVDGRWRNIVGEADEAASLAPGDTAQIAARPDRFREILADVSPAERIEVALEQVEAARMHLRRYPASCAARTRREDAFARLYVVTEEVHGWDQARTDAEHRRLEDYVFAELEYEASRTCCWNRSTAAMFDIVMDHARAEQAEAEAAGMCMAPTVFRAEGPGDAGYARWQSHAEALGRGGEWVAWSADETCPWQDVVEDTPSERAVTGFCDALGGVDEPEPEPEPEPVEPPDACDAFGQDDAREDALELSGPMHAEICADDADWYLLPDGGEVVLSFRHAEGDLDLEALDVEGRRLGSSTSVSDEERWAHDAPFYVRVYGYAGAANGYTITVE